MERYDQTFKCTCKRGDVVLRTSRKPYSYVKQYYACPCSKPGTQDRGCGYFMWMDDLRLHISSSSGSSAPLSSNPGTLTRPSYSPGTSRSAQNLKKAECSNCKFLAEKIKTLEAKIKILEGVLEMERHPEKHTLETEQISAKILVYNQNAAATRNAKHIGALQKFVGPDVKAFLSHVKPALLSAVEAL
ncbi:phospholipase-like protein [Tanacetum coccineum]